MGGGELGSAPGGQVVGAPPPPPLLFSAPLADRAPAWRTSLGLISCLDTEWFD